MITRSSFSAAGYTCQLKTTKTNYNGCGSSEVNYAASGITPPAKRDSWIRFRSCKRWTLK